MSKLIIITYFSLSNLRFRTIIKSRQKISWKCVLSNSQKRLNSDNKVLKSGIDGSKKVNIIYFRLSLNNVKRQYKEIQYK